MFVIAIAALLIISLLGTPMHLSQDGWLALIAGRLVAAHGIPHHDYFTYLAHGARWVDQQWLAQWLLYQVVRLGGLPLLCVLYVVMAVTAFGGAVAAARRLGGEDLHVLMATLPGAFFYLVTALSIRTQGLAYPLFVVLLWLLASEHARPAGRRVLWVFPILVLWGNLHGSVTLGVGLTMLFALVELVRHVRADGRVGLLDARAWAMLLISPFTLIATPYGTGTIHYLRLTLFNAQFSRVVTEWKPVTSVPILAVPLLGAICVVLVMTVRALRRGRELDGSGPGAFAVLTLLALTVGAVVAVRNITWFGLGLVVLLPAIITQARGGGPAPLRRSRTNRRIALAALALACLVTLAVLGRPSSWFTSTYPNRAVPTLRALLDRHPGARILADVRYADWLIWEDPSRFSGRVAYDTSFELLTSAQLTGIADLAAPRPEARRLLARFPIWMLYPPNRRVNRSLLHRTGVRVVHRDRRVIIALNGSGAGA